MSVNDAQWDGSEVIGNVVPYVSVAVADQYFAQKPTMQSLWNTFTADQKLAFLRQATLELDELPYKGYKRGLSGQQRQWPRVLNDGSYHDIFYDSDVLPAQVGMACCEQAWHVAEASALGRDRELRRDLQAQGVSSINRVGAGEQSSLSGARTHRVCAAAMTYIRIFVLRSMNL